MCTKRTVNMTTLLCNISIIITTSTRKKRKKKERKKKKREREFQKKAAQSALALRAVMLPLDTGYSARKSKKLTWFCRRLFGLVKYMEKSVKPRSLRIHVSSCFSKSEKQYRSIVQKCVGNT